MVILLIQEYQLYLRKERNMSESTIDPQKIAKHAVTQAFRRLQITMKTQQIIQEGLNDLIQEQIKKAIPSDTILSEEDVTTISEELADVIVRHIKL